MFEFLYLGRVLALAENNPKEAIRVTGATIVGLAIVNSVAEVRKVKEQRKAAELRVVAARLELELAEIKLKQMP